MAVSVAAIAAVTVGLLVNRERQERPEPSPAEIPAGETAPAIQSLDAIRAAGW